MVDLPFWAYRRLKKPRLLERDRQTGMRRIRGDVFGFMDLCKGADVRHDGPVRCLDLRMERSLSPGNGFANAFLKALGRDCPDLPNPASDRFREMESDFDDTRVPTRNLVLTEIVAVVALRCYLPDPCALS